MQIPVSYWGLLVGDRKAPLAFAPPILAFSISPVDKP